MAPWALAGVGWRKGAAAWSEWGVGRCGWLRLSRMRAWGATVRGHAHALEPSGEGSGGGREGGDELEWDALGFSNLLYRNIIVNGPHVIAKWVTHRVTGMGYSRMHPHPLHPMGEVFTH
jgi:hypothetical protein